MKLKNSPGHKNKRRIEALNRYISSSLDNDNVKTAIENTKAKIISQDEADNIKTKKFRG